MRVIPRLFTLCVALLALATLVAGCSSGDSTAVDRPKADYDAGTGRLRRLTFDSNRNGRNDAVSVMDGTRIDHLELDTDENGAVDRWEYYDADRRLVKAGISRQNDGIIDAFEFYNHGNGNDDIITRIEVSTRRDNRFNRVEFYADGILARVEEDEDGDGRVDKWELYRPVANRLHGEPPSRVVSVAFDETHRGTATRRLVFANDGTVQRVEIDPDGDGIFVAQPSDTGAR